MRENGTLVTGQAKPASSHGEAINQLHDPLHVGKSSSVAVCKP
jgi:hypothetical protein